MSFFVNLPPSGGGGIASINGDTTADQVIAAGAGISVVSSGGTTTISNTDVATESFTIWQPDHGTSPTASSPTDTMDVTSSDATITITGNSSTKTLNFQLASGIALNKLAALSASIVPVTDASGFLSSSATTSTELGYLSGVTSAIQTQLTAKAPTASPTFSGTIGTALTVSRALVTDGSGNLAAATTTATELGYVNGVTSAIQTQLAAKLPLSGGTMTGTLTMGSHNVQGSLFLLSDGEVDLYSNSTNNFTLFGGQIYWRGQMNWRDNNTHDIGVAGNAPRDLILGRNIRASGNLGVGNSAAGSTLGSVVKKIEVFNAAGTSLGFIPVYDAIT